MTESDREFVDDRNIAKLPKIDVYDKVLDDGDKDATETEKSESCDEDSGSGATEKSQFVRLRA